MKKIINHFIVLFIGAVIIAPWTGCDSKGPDPVPVCTDAQKADPTNATCYVPVTKVYPITATVATFIVNGATNVICASATPSVSITFTSAGVTGATFATAYPKGIVATIKGTPTLNTVASGAARPNPNIDVSFTIPAAALLGTLVLTSPLPVATNQTGTTQTFAKGETYDVTILLTDGNTSTNTFSFANGVFKINVQ